LQYPRRQSTPQGPAKSDPTPGTWPWRQVFVAWVEEGGDPAQELKGHTCPGTALTR
jgi:hypothetical protein